MHPVQQKWWSRAGVVCLMTVAMSVAVSCEEVVEIHGELSGPDMARPAALQNITSSIVINEVDADQASTDSAEFVELYDGGVGNTPLDGLTLVFFNGNGDVSYQAFDLDGYSTSADGYFVLCGDMANTSNCDMDVSPNTNLIQNGQDAVALYAADAVDFPGSSAITLNGLIDALVYDTSDSDDPELLVLLNNGQPQVDENSGGDGTAHSNQRCPNGAGGQRNTNTYTQAFPTPGGENNCATEPEVLSCDDNSEITLIHEIQGAGMTSPLEGQTVVVDGVVVGDFQNNDAADQGDLNGFYVQEELADEDSLSTTSEGVFVYAPDANDVSVGDHVRIRGTVAEYETDSGASSLTELTYVEVALCSTAAPLPAPTPLTLPVATISEFEQYEGMRVTLTQSLVISEYYNYDRYNEIVLAKPVDGQDRPYQPTAIFEPGSAASAALADLNARSKITLDDGRTSQNSDPTRHPNGDVFDLTNRFRGGDHVQGATGIIDNSHGIYRIHPTSAASYTAANPREAAPDVGGDLKIASFNVLNYFTTFGSRGADNAEEFARQRSKIISAITEIDADVVGLIEIENNSDVALRDLVSGLNDATGDGTYAPVETGTIGTDEITVAFIYKPATVVPAGPFAVLDDPSFVDPNNLGSAKNRPALAQTFADANTDTLFTVVVNHLKSKGSACGAGDDDPEQGNCNKTRTLAAKVLSDWLATDPTGSGSDTVLIIGDLNAYDKEDPIDALRAGADNTVGTNDDFVDLEYYFNGEYAYSYLFSGQFGYLDYALINESAVNSVSDVAVWHINADEPDILDYDMSYKQDAQDALFEPNPYRASDHDPVVIGLDTCDSEPPEVKVSLSRSVLLLPNHRYRYVHAAVEAIDTRDANPKVTLLSVTSSEPNNGPADGNTVNDVVILDDTHFKLRAERSSRGDGRVYTVTYKATDSCGNSAIGEATVAVPKHPLRWLLERP